MMKLNRFQTTPLLLITSTNAFHYPFKPKSISISSRKMSSLVSIPEAIEAHRNKNNIFIDGSWHMPNTRNAREEFQKGPRIRGAKFFDIDDVCAPNNKNLPHMKPTPQQFALAMDLMSIAPSNTLYIYSNVGCAFSHRSYWTFRSAGHDPTKVKLVQGSLDEWKANGGELELEELNGDDDRLFRMPTDWAERSPSYKCSVVDNTVDMDQMLDIVRQKTDGVVVDARSAGRFYGRDPEPRPGLRGGHMPNALNVPFVSLLDKDMTKFKPLDEVKKIFIEAGIKPYEECGDGERKVVCSCGSGVTAAALAVGLEECGLRKKEDIFVYDGSWIEWGGDDNTPIVKEE